MLTRQAHINAVSEGYKCESNCRHNVAFFAKRLANLSVKYRMIKETADIHFASEHPFSMNTGQLQLAWPGDHAGWILLAQKNPPDTGLGTNSATLPRSTLGDLYYIKRRCILVYKLYFTFEDVLLNTFLRVLRKV